MPTSSTGTAPLPRPVDDALEIRFHLGRRQPTQAVIRAQRHNEQTDIPFERPPRPAQSVSGGVAGDAGVHDIQIDSGVLELPVQHFGICLLTREAKARGEAVAEGDDLRRSGRRSFSWRTGRVRQRLHGRV